MKLLVTGLDQFIGNMINPKNKNYSFLAISKNTKNKNYEMNSAFQKIFTPHRSKRQGKSLENKIDLSYISPNTQQINIFKSKLYTSLHQKQIRHVKLASKSKQFLIQQSMNSTLSFKTLERSFYKKPNKSFYQGTDKRKSIRQYMCQLSQDKRKQYENKTVELSSHAIKSQQQAQKSHPMLIIRKFKRIRDQQKGQKNKQSNHSIFKERDAPIHHTQIYYFSKKKSRTEPIEPISDPDKGSTVRRKHITMSRIFELREQLKKQQKSKDSPDKQLLLINEIYPTVAIITTRQREDRQHQSRQEKIQPSLRYQPNANTNTVKSEEEEISPWFRKNPNYSQYD